MRISLSLVHGAIFMLLAPRRQVRTVNRGTPILITGLTTGCSNAEPPPFYGATRPPNVVR
jgi:hypothetical protein